MLVVDVYRGGRVRRRSEVGNVSLLFLRIHRCPILCFFHQSIRIKHGKKNSLNSIFNKSAFLPHPQGYEFAAEGWVGNVNFADFAGAHFSEPFKRCPLHRLGISP